MTREMIAEGFKNRTISIEDEGYGCMGLCCKIGDNAFYFAGEEGEGYTAEEYLKEYTEDEIIDEIFGVLKDKQSAEENGLSEGEYELYELLLEPSDKGKAPKNKNDMER